MVLKLNAMLDFVFDRYRFDKSDLLEVALLDLIQEYSLDVGNGGE
jgi:hypothetical protein